MKAIDLENILKNYPDAEVKFEAISNASVFMTSTYQLVPVNGYRITKDCDGNITNIILSNFNIQPL